MTFLNNYAIFISQDFDKEKTQNIKQEAEMEAVPIITIILIFLVVLSGIKALINLIATVKKIKTGKKN